MRNSTKRLVSILAIATILLFPVQPAFSISQESGASASVTVNEYISVTLYNAPISFGSLDPGSSTLSTNPLNITVNSVTNVNTNISINGTDFSDGGTNTLGVGNFSYRNDTVTTWSALSGTFAGDTTFTDWGTIVAPSGGAPANRTAYLNVTIPSGQPAATYNGAIYIRIQSE